MAANSAPLNGAQRRRVEVHRCIILHAALWLALCGCGEQLHAEELLRPAGPVVDADFPGGNIVVESIDGDVVRLRQDQRDTREPWFYWCFRTRGAAGRRLAFEFTAGPVVGMRGPAVSRDGGANWSWLGATKDDSRFEFAFGTDDHEVRFAFSPPYLEQDLQALLNRHAGNPRLVCERLCQSRQGRTVEALRLGRVDGAAQQCVLLVARHHACESSTGPLLEGLVDAVLTGGGAGNWLGERVELLIVPFMDKDGVENGDQGKLRLPHDPWLDYAGASLYPAVAALREKVPAWSQGRLRLAIDLHAPSRRDERIYFAGPKSDSAAAQLAAFGELFQAVQRGPLRFDPADDLPFGTGWNSAATYGERKSFALWAEELPGVRLATTLELPYAQVKGHEVTPEAIRRLGGELAEAIARYLQSLGSATGLR